ncbi:helix-turn-helix domain-containing protein [Actinocorallia sp. API 0066]|uniref:PucR family transcriptional regulator n=1 Tax=Actinocorallia sp. API 0066 TaxID=2896846 RepID=UPI001E5963D4|nr:helix-turn-helix domain-containing protein [Actinocorallia sp. API 0066]MCD0449286.1 helix-turn-helix domain-containing protein [Actinocorallia sp. API 0066]
MPNVITPSSVGRTRGVNPQRDFTALTHRPLRALEDGFPADVESALDEITDYACNLVKSEISAYVQVPEEAVRAVACAGVRLACAALREDRPPTRAELRIMARIGAHPARSGMPFHTLLHIVKLIVGFAIEVSEKRVANGAEPLVPDVTRLWMWTIEVLEAAGEEHRRIETDLSGKARDRRAGFLRALFAGEISESGLAAQASEFGLDVNSRYLAFRAPLPNARARWRIEGALKGIGLAEVHNGELMGVLTQPPRACADLIAVGEQVPLKSASLSFSQASTALRVANGFGMRGVVAITDVPVHVAVLESSVSDTIVQRCFGGVPARQRALFIETLTAYLDHDQRVPEAADALHLHQNTLRYRLRQFEKATGLSLERLADTMTVWWALQYLRLVDSDVK